MEIINKSDEKLLAEYEQFASTSKYGNFMQSLKWPKVKDNWGWDAVISRDADGNIRGTCLIIIKKVPIFGVTFMYAPHGPVCDWSDILSASMFFTIFTADEEVTQTSQTLLSAAVVFM